MTSPRSSLLHGSSLNDSRQDFVKIEHLDDVPRRSSPDTTAKVEGNSSEPPSPPPGPPPNGGLLAWTQVLGSFLFFFNNWGIVQSFGAFQTYYEGGLLSASTPSDISWIGTVQASLLICVGILSGPIYDKGYFRYLVTVGSVLIVLGLFMLSLSRAYYQVFLSQGICVGLGSGLIYVPSLAIVSSYFTTRRAFAIGLSAAGSAVGGIIYPVVFHRLQPKIGFPWATRVIAFTALALLLAANALMRPRTTRGGPARAYIDKRAFKEVPFLCFTLGLFFIFFGFYVPIFYIPSYAQINLGTSADLSFYLIAVLNASSFFGRIIPSFLGDKFGPLLILVPTMFASGILVLAWIGIHRLSGFIVFCVCYGFASAILVTIPPAAVPSLSPSMDVIGTRLGMAWFPSGISILVSAPIAAATAHVFDNQWLSLQLWSGTVMFVGGCFTLVPLIHLERQKKLAGQER